jgi:hypothetical protein
MTQTIVIQKSERKAAWGEHISEAGFERSQFYNKYKKRIVLWSKDGIDYTASTKIESDGSLSITLTEYN